MDLIPAHNDQPEASHRARDALILIGRLGNVIVGHSVNAILGETFDALRVRTLLLLLICKMPNECAISVADAIEPTNRTAPGPRHLQTRFQPQPALLQLHRSHFAWMDGQAHRGAGTVSWLYFDPRPFCVIYLIQR